jgi:hypothetical protein
VGRLRVRDDAERRREGEDKAEMMQMLQSRQQGAVQKPLISQSLNDEGVALDNDPLGAIARQGGGMDASPRESMTDAGMRAVA